MHNIRPEGAKTMSAIEIRSAGRADIPAMKRIIDATGLFPSAMLDEMMRGALDGSAPDELWFVAGKDTVTACAYCAPERLTSGTWNLLMIAVNPDQQGHGVGAGLMRHVERVLAERGERLLLVETSGLPEFEPVRGFYRNLGYGEEARIRDFYQQGDDKVIFRRALTAAAH